MMKDEFMARLRQHAPTAEDLSAEEYAIVEEVYMWHPSIPNVGGKEAIALLYHLGGVVLMHDMLSTAKKEEQKEERRRELRNAISAHEAEILRLRAELASV